MTESGPTAGDSAKVTGGRGTGGDHVAVAGNGRSLRRRGRLRLAHSQAAETVLGGARMDISHCVVLGSEPQCAGEALGGMQVPTWHTTSPSQGTGMEVPLEQ